MNWNKPCDDYDGVKGMRAGRLARIGKVPDQFECDDSPDSRPCSTQAADRSNGSAPIEIGRQHVCDRRKRCVGKGGEPEKQRNQVQIHRENCRNKKQYAEASKDDQRFSRRTEWPAAPDQVAGNSTAEEIAQVRGKKWNPHCHQAALERNTFCEQVDGKPVRDEEPNGIGKALGDDRSPSLGQLQKVAPSQPRFSIGLSFLGLGKNHPALGVADARMILRQVIHFSPDDQPQESEHSWNDKGDAPTPAKSTPAGSGKARPHRPRMSRCRTAQRPVALALWKPFGNGLARARPVGGFSRSEQKTK